MSNSTLDLIRSILASLRPWAQSTETTIDDLTLDVFEKVLSSPILSLWFLDTVEKGGYEGDLSGVPQDVTQAFLDEGITEEQFRLFLDQIVPYIVWVVNWLMKK